MLLGRLALRPFVSPVRHCVKERLVNRIIEVGLGRAISGGRKERYLVGVFVTHSLSLVLRMAL